MSNNVEVPFSLISFLLDIREERKYNMMLHSREIFKKYLKSDNCDEEGRNFLFTESGNTTDSLRLPYHGPFPLC